MELERQYPEIVRFLDTSDEYVNKASEFIVNDDRYLIVTQTSDVDGGQILFKLTADGWMPIDADTHVDILQHSQLVSSRTSVGSCSASSENDHVSVHTAAKNAVNQFSSATGPDGGNLACVWSLRHIVFNTLGRWITRTDGTSVFDAELQKCYGSTLQENDVRAGGIIIAPTITRPDGTRIIGHVGLLGPPGAGDARLIYSNSSSEKKWKQNFTLNSWIRRYRAGKGLKVRFYPLPFRPAPTG